MPSVTENIQLRHDFADDNLRRDIIAVCRDVVGVFEKRVGKPPPLGVKPLVIQKAPDDIPRAVVNGLPREYIINVTCLDSRDYCQICYQLGHELGHVFVDPQKNNWFIESVATTMSLVVLSDMGEKWRDDPPFQNWSSWAHHFPEYREGRLDEKLKELDLKSDEASLMSWLRRGCPKILSEGRFDRAEQHACALLITSVAEKHRQSLGAITFLGAATSSDGRTDFEKWGGLVAPGERDFVGELSRLFHPLTLVKERNKAK